MSLRDDAPLLASYLDALRSDAAPFTIPGHKRRAGRLDQGLGQVVDGDVPLYGGLDTTKLSRGRLADAEARAGRLWGADWCRFSCGGSTHGNQALCLALGRPGDEVIVARSLHRSTLLGLVLAGLVPVWLPTRIHPATALPLGVAIGDVAAALDAHPAARAVLLTEPGYLGAISDISRIAALAHLHGVPLVVDQAWGAHLGFHPGLPPHALALGADAAVTSAHKALPAYSQGALVLARTELLDPQRLETAFEAGHTTSPAGSVLASIDACRALLETRGPELLGRLLDLVDGMRRRLLAEVPGLVVPDAQLFGAGRCDPCKLVLVLPGTGADGVLVEAELIAAGVPVEMADRDTIVPMVTVADDADTTGRFLDVLIPSLRRHAGTPRDVAPSISWDLRPEQVLDPRTAYFSPSHTVAVRDAVGEVSAELVALYPPGVPVLAPGERITEQVLDALLTARAHGVRVAYAADPGLATLRVATLR